MDYILSITGKSKRLSSGSEGSFSNPNSPVSPTREIVFRNSHAGDLKYNSGLFSRVVQDRSPDAGQKKKTDARDVRRMSFQRPRGTTEYSVESRDTLNSIALKFDTTPNELVQLNKLFSRAVVPGKVLYVPDPNYVSSPESSPSLSPVSPLSPTSSDTEQAKDGEVSQRRDAPAQPRPARVVSSTSEEEEALTEKFLKINCKYITDGKGVVSGVLLVTPSNIMFDPHKADVLVQQSGCAEYGIMCPLDELLSAAMCTEVTDARIKEFVPPDLELPASAPEPSQMRRAARSNLEDAAQRAKDAGNDSASTAPRSTEASLSEDVFTESEISPVRDDPDPSSDELRRLRSSGASSESVQTINQADPPSSTTTPAPDALSPSHTPRRDPGSDEASRREGSTSDCQAQQGEPSVGRGEQTTSAGAGEGEAKSHITPESQASDSIEAKKQDQSGVQTQNQKRDQNQDRDQTHDQTQSQTVDQNQEGVQNQESQSSLEELRKLWKSHTTQSTNEHEDTDQLTVIEAAPATQERPGAGQAPSGPKDRRRPRGLRFLCLRVGRPMRRTFLSQASASMHQYAQRDRKKHEYWFAFPPDRSDHLYGFFVQWSPDMYGEEVGEGPREPGFVVVKKNRQVEMGSDEPPVPDITSKDWEVVSSLEYQRRIDALNSEDLRSLCKRLQITTKEVANSKLGPAVRTDLESEVFRPSLNEPSDLLQPEHIEKLAKNLPPRTIGYPWTLAFSSSKHGMSIKSLYRTMRGQDTPVLMVIKDSDGQLFGALASEPFKVSDSFYGTGETFLFTFCPEFEVFKWTGDNMFFLKGDVDSLAFGGGGGEFGLWLDGDLYHGRSNPCKTFGNPRLSQKEDFVLQDIEIWAFE
ncbi:oxidation resistance protein 1b isoform X1 [Osmerus mordax]|uniref:oxidation resistance protein 1b isoform X1 n=1 Tax=Osmerus mordax TaxID=8014 RepID=UPI0035106FFC